VFVAERVKRRFTSNRTDHFKLYRAKAKGPSGKKLSKPSGKKLSKLSVRQRFKLKAYSFLDEG
jgi:hypothetical protein